MKTVIIVPTYNEQLNIEALVTALQEQFRGILHEMHILVVDDHSPDGTAQVVRTLQAQYPNVHLLEGDKAGLGAAYIRGMRHAMQTLQAEVVFEMDADFSHQPADVRRLMAAIDTGADFVIGSRYIQGGSIPASWGWRRQLTSRVGNLVARYVTGLSRVRDCTAGFRAIRTALLERIDLEHLRVQGYAFQVALLHAAMVEQGQITEIPVDFIDRQQGESKLGLSDIIEFIVNAWWIRLRSSSTFLKFGIVGTSGVLINLGGFACFLAAGLSKYVASPLAIALSIIWNFLLNNVWTFREHQTKDRTRLTGLTFSLVSCLTMVVSYVTFVGLSQMFPHVKPSIHQCLGIIPATMLNYFLNAYWTFRHVASPTPDQTLVARPPLTAPLRRRGCNSITS